MNCHYCQKKLTEVIATTKEVLAYDCPDCRRYTSVEMKKNCCECKKEFTYIYDHLIDGPNYIPMCLDCRGSYIKKWFEDNHELLVEEMKKKKYFLKNIPTREPDIWQEPFTLEDIFYKK